MFKVINVTLAGNIDTGIKCPSTSIRMMHDALVLGACRIFGGREGRDWRIVQDRTIIGFHAVSNDGNYLELR